MSHLIHFDRSFDSFLVVLGGFEDRGRLEGWGLSNLEDDLWQIQHHGRRVAPTPVGWPMRFAA
jgi:hypothetical protein